MDGKYLAQNLTLTQTAKFLNKEFYCKKTGENFKVTDVQGYLKRGHLPNYLGGNIIEESKAIESVKLYNIWKDNGKNES